MWYIIVGHQLLYVGQFRTPGTLIGYMKVPHESKHHTNFGFLGQFFKILKILEFWQSIFYITIGAPIFRDENDNNLAQFKANFVE